MIYFTNVKNTRPALSLNHTSPGFYIESRIRRTPNSFLSHQMYPFRNRRHSYAKLRCFKHAHNFVMDNLSIRNVIKSVTVLKIS